jgi:hypothetical protein
VQMHGIRHHHFDRHIKTPVELLEKHRGTALSRSRHERPPEGAPIFRSSATRFFMSSYLTGIRT